MLLKNKLDIEVQSHWADNLINAIKFYRTGDEHFFHKITIHGEDCAYCAEFYDVLSCRDTCPIAIVFRSDCGDTPWLKVDCIHTNCLISVARDEPIVGRTELYTCIRDMYLALKKVYGIIDKDAK